MLLERSEWKPYERKSAVSCFVWSVEGKKIVLFGGKSGVQLKLVLPLILYQIKVCYFSYVTYNTNRKDFLYD